MAGCGSRGERLGSPRRVHTRRRSLLATGCGALSRTCSAAWRSPPRCSSPSGRCRRGSRLSAAGWASCCSQHAELPVHHARRDRGVRIPSAVGAARPVPAQGPRAGQRLGVDTGRLSGCRPAVAQRAWRCGAQVTAAGPSPSGCSRWPCLRWWAGRTDASRDSQADDGADYFRPVQPGAPAARQERAAATLRSRRGWVSTA